MNIDDLTIGQVKTELDLHVFLKGKGFSTNYKKSENENGTDVIALKNGVAFLIEHKTVEKRDNGSYRYSGDVKGDILLCSLPSGKSFFVVNEKVSFTKTARLIEELAGDN